MKTIILERLSMTNFKGIDNMTVDLANKVAFRGANGTGKTTISDAIWWALFNKDSNDSKEFPVKRKDADGNNIPNLIVEVELVLNIDGQRQIMRRIQSEVWSTKRGSNTAEFRGDEQAFYVNETKIPKTEYDLVVGQIMDQETFKLLTNPMYFMNIEKKQRREILMSHIGNITDIESSLRSQSSNHLLDAEWNTDLNRNKSFSQFYEYLKQTSKKNDNDLEIIPNSIDELQRTIKEFPDELTIKSLISGYTKELAQLNEVKPATKPQNIIDAERLLREKELEHSSIVDKANQEYASKRSETARIKQDHEYHIASLESKIILLKNDIKRFTYDLQDYEAKKKGLLDQYYNVKNSKYTAPVIETHCPVCHQTLPDMNVDQVIADDQENWKATNQKVLSDIQTKGKEVTVSIEARKVDIAKYQDTIAKLEKESEELRMQLSALPDTSKITPADFVDQAKVEAINKEIIDIKDVIGQWYSNEVLPDVLYSSPTNQRKAELQAQINDNNQRLGALNAQKATLQRIDELKAREKEMQAAKNKFKTLVYLCEVFEMNKNQAIEAKLSSMFGKVKWRLFEVQNNGGYTQVCEPYVNGKPYAAQSTGEKILTGCDIINTFQSLYGIDVFVIIDNRESLTLDIPLTGQVISMYADDRYTTLQQA